MPGCSPDVPSLGSGQALAGPRTRPRAPELSHHGRRQPVGVEVVVGHGGERQHWGSFSSTSSGAWIWRLWRTCRDSYAPGLRPRQAVAAVEGERACSAPGCRPSGTPTWAPRGSAPSCPTRTVHKNGDRPSGVAVASVGSHPSVMRVIFTAAIIPFAALGLEVEEETLESIDAGFAPGAHRRRRRRTKRDNRGSQFQFARSPLP